jgi:hypothetical protein
MTSKPHSDNEPEAATYFEIQRNRDGLPEPGEEKPVPVIPPLPPTSPWHHSSKATTPFGTTPSVAGPGGGRMVMKSGSQGQHGSAVSGTARPGANKPIFPGFK